jgi:hypothetical protein
MQERLGWITDRMVEVLRGLELGFRKCLQYEGRPEAGEEDGTENFIVLPSRLSNVRL